MTDTPDLQAVWNATRVRRWHTHPVLSRTDDFIDGHTHRVVVLLLSLFPDASRNLLVAASLHDMGEYASGDLANPAKKRYPELRSLVAVVERRGVLDLGLRCPYLTHEEEKQLWLGDRLDAWLWMTHHAIHLRVDPDWRRAREDLLHRARDLGVEAIVAEAVG